MSRVSSLGLVLLLGACPRFQQTPNNLWGNSHMVEVANKRIFVRDLGQGPTILLIHGYGAAHDTWARMLPRLSQSHRLLALDLPGFGRSDKYAGNYSPEALSDFLIRLLDQKSVQQVDLIAHSWGSSIALSMALKYPRRIRSITLLGAWIYEDQLSPFLIWSRAPVIGELLFSLFYTQRLDDRMALAFYNPDPFTHPDQVDQVRTALGRPGAIASALAAARGQRFGELQRRYTAIRQPTLLIWGQDDRISLPAFGHRLNNELKNARLVVIPQCGHIPMLERPTRVLQEVARFLAETAANNSAPIGGTTPPSSASLSRQGRVP